MQSMQFNPTTAQCNTCGNSNVNDFFDEPHIRYLNWLVHLVRDLIVVLSNDVWSNSKQRVKVANRRSNRCHVLVRQHRTLDARFHASSTNYNLAFSMVLKPERNCLMNFDIETKQNENKLWLELLTHLCMSRWSYFFENYKQSAVASKSCSKLWSDFCGYKSVLQPPCPLMNSA